MLKTKLLQSEIPLVLASNGDVAKILIADGNFPISTCTSTRCKKVFLNFSTNLLTVREVLEVLKEYATIERALVLIPRDGSVQLYITNFMRY